MGAEETEELFCLKTMFTIWMYYVVILPLVAVELEKSRKT